VVGVPVKAPVEALSEMPDGKEPETTEYELVLEADTPSLYAAIVLATEETAPSVKLGAGKVVVTNLLSLVLSPPEVIVAVIV
jgi:hypothetical protein